MLGNPGRPKTDWIFQAFEVGFPIRISMDQSLFAAPHGFSQRITSFFACACQGIHQMPLNHFFVLIANAHPCLIWKTHPLRLRSEGFQIWPYGQGFPCCSVWTVSPLTIKQGHERAAVTFYNRCKKCHRRVDPVSLKITPSDLRAGSLDQLLEIDPRMRGQATSTKPSVRQRPKPSNNQRSLSDTNTKRCSFGSIFSSQCMQNRRFSHMESANLFSS